MPNLSAPSDDRYLWVLRRNSDYIFAFYGTQTQAEARTEAEIERSFAQSRRNGCSGFPYDDIRDYRRVNEYSLAAVDPDNFTLEDLARACPA